MNDSLRRGTGIPIYLQLSDILLQRILNGEWKTGVSLPTEPELCEEFGVARGTIRQALSRLEHEGFIRRERGRGTLVIWNNGRPRTQGLSGSQIGFVVPYVRDSFVPTILLGVEQAAAEEGLSVTFKHVGNDTSRQTEVLEALVAQRLVGVVLYPVDSTPFEPLMKLLRSGYPFVLADRYVRGIASDYVMSDHFGGALRATQHLIQLGHERIGFVSWSDPAVSLEHRAAGYQQALTEAGLPHDSALVSVVEGYPAVSLVEIGDFLTLHPEITAIFAANDQIALGVYRAARQLGMRIPHDIALVGFDDLDFTPHLDVPLTTVAQSALDIGRTAVQLLMRRVRQPVEDWQQVVLPTRLVIRSSCGAHLRDDVPTSHEPNVG